MAKPPDLWWMARRKGWFTKIDGRQIPLAKGRENKSEARLVLNRLLAERGPGGAPRTDALGLATLLDLFLARVARECKPTTLVWYRGHLDTFAGRIGDIPAAELRPKHLDHWLATDGPGWNDSTRRGAITAVKAVTSWATRQGYLSTDALKAVTRPRMGRRKAVSPELAPRVFEAAGDQAFEDLLTALFESGCRPGEVFRVEAKDFDAQLGTWVVEGKSTSRTGELRTIYLTARLIAVCQRLAEAHPIGPLFRNAKGRPWTRNAVRCRFLRRRETLGSVQAYGLRHLWGTDALARGVPPAAVAAMMGHRDLKMLMEHYGHVDERSALLRASAEVVRPAGDGGIAEAG